MEFGQSNHTEKLNGVFDISMNLYNITEEEHGMIFDLTNSLRDYSTKATVLKNIVRDVEEINTIEELEELKRIIKLCRERGVM